MLLALTLKPYPSLCQSYDPLIHFSLIHSQRVNIKSGTVSFHHVFRIFCEQIN